MGVAFSAEGHPLTPCTSLVPCYEKASSSRNDLSAHSSDTGLHFPCCSHKLRVLLMRRVQSSGHLQSPPTSPGKLRRPVKGHGRSAAGPCESEHAKAMDVPQSAAEHHCPQQHDPSSGDRTPNSTDLMPCSGSLRKKRRLYSRSAMNGRLCSSDRLHPDIGAPPQDVFVCEEDHVPSADDLAGGADDPWGWFDAPGDSESEPLGLTSGGVPSTPPPEHLIGQSIPVQALWQVTGGMCPRTSSLSAPALMTRARGSKSHVHDPSESQKSVPASEHGASGPAQVRFGSAEYDCCSSRDSFTDSDFPCGLAQDEGKCCERSSKCVGDWSEDDCPPRELDFESSEYEELQQQQLIEDSLRALFGQHSHRGFDQEQESVRVWESTNIYGSAVSKSFYCPKCDRVSNTVVKIPKFQLVRRGAEQFAEFLVVVSLGELTFSVWRRYSEFARLAESLALAETREQFPNALFSWQCLNQRKRWYRCVDKDYLTLKCFLLERFLHDFVFESTEASSIYEFIGS